MSGLIKSHIYYIALVYTEDKTRTPCARQYLINPLIIIWVGKCRIEPDDLSGREYSILL